jgi:sugar phosphate isomerase/epimerase
MGETATMAEGQPFQPLRGGGEPAGPARPLGVGLGRSVPLSLSTTWGTGRLADLGELVDEARALGIRRLELGRACTPRVVEQIIARLGDDVRLSSLHNVCPRPVDDHDEPVSLPSLAEPDPLAREVIVRWTEETIRLAAYWGVPAVVLHLGEIPIDRAVEAELHARRRAGGAATPAGVVALARLRAHRQAVAGPYWAAARRSLEEILLLAEEAGVRLGLETRADLMDLPSFDELGRLLAEFPSDMLGYWHDTGHAQRQQALGAARAADWLAAYGRRLVGLHLHDCAGLDDHLPPGTGEVDFAAVLAAAPPAALHVCEFRSTLTAAQVATGLAHLRRLGFDDGGGEGDEWGAIDSR